MKKTGPYQYHRPANAATNDRVKHGVCVGCGSRHLISTHTLLCVGRPERLPTGSGDTYCARQTLKRTGKPLKEIAMVALATGSEVT